MKEITGETKLFGILADTIHHVKTPQRMNEYFARAGYDGVLVPFHARPDNLATVLEGLRRLENLVGIIVTVPHKTAILELCDEASDTTRKIGAANVEIGRAACRERVCRYVEICVVAVPLTKKKY